MVLTGPRQSGKTTLLKKLFGGTSKYVSLELPDVRAAALADPRGFLQIYASPVIFDEVQYAPDLLPYIKERIDAHRSARGQYLLTGSQNLMITEGITESLAGRVAMLRLLPLSHREILGHAAAPLPWESVKKTSGRKNISMSICGRVSCAGDIRNSWRNLTGTSRFGTRAISRPTWSVTFGHSGKSAT
jgi:predicted AAA+ superfamily ATPase